MTRRLRHARVPGVALAAVYALGGLALLGTAGCASFHSDAPAVQVYALDPTFAAAPAPAVPPAAAAPVSAVPTLQVLRPLAAPGLDTTGIALTRDGQRLDYYAASRWPAPLPELVQSLAVESLRASGKFRSVQPDAGAFAADLVLQLEIKRCQAAYAGEGAPFVQVQLLATLGRRDERAILATVTAEASVPATDNRMRPVVAAFQSALGAALTDLATRVTP
jgi:cholesterol transport system auxiliary component